MPLRTKHFGSALLAGLLLTGGAHAAPVYLNIDNIDVMVGAGTSPGSFNNTFNGGQTIDKVIDAPSAIAEEFHNQSTHIWFTADELGGGLELEFDFGTEYDITTLHFWNYTAEGFDVDNLSFTFFNDARVEVGSLDVIPDLGSSPGILAQDYLLAAPLNVQYVTVFLSGDNRQVDFQNIGFTAELSTAEPPDPTDPPTTTVPEPGSLGLLMMAGLLASCRRFRTG
ncbi:MAG: PEP-CTERM sorting domain-containing protein [Pseudomonadales bacterium]